MRYKWIWIVALAPLLTSINASAWNVTSHRLIAVIAYQSLAPQPRQRFTELLKQHPQYKQVWKSEQPASIPEGLHLFMSAAAWPDEVRHERELAHFHRQDWHYINLPFVHPDQPYITAKSPEFSNIITAISHNLMSIRADATKTDEKAIALSWLLHLVGDIHQPLHTCNFFSDEFPDGDKGGNLFYINLDHGGQVRLHEFWDFILGNSNHWRTMFNDAIWLMRHHPLERLSSVEMVDHTRWAQESYNIAKEIVYQHGRLPGGLKTHTSEVLPKSYEEQAKSIAERQVVLSGYRLAALCKQLFQEAP
jgi:hypothetical protein